MARILDIDSNDYHVEPDPTDPMKATVQIGNKRFAAQVDAHQPNLAHLVGDAARTPTHSAKSADGVWVWIEGRARVVRKQNKRRQGGSAATMDTVTPPMPGVVMRVLVAPEDIVEKGQEVVVISAMKMEAALHAPYAGTVTSVNTAEGANVMPGDKLVDIEPEEKGDAHE